jgi:proteic killer suppression protein
MEFADPATRDIYDGLDSGRARKALPANLHTKAQNKLSLLAFADSVEDLRAPPSNHLEKLRGDRNGQYSIRINDRYRICFRWTEGEAVEVEIVDYH